MRRNPYPDHGEKGKNVNMVAYRGYHGVCDHELLDCFEEEDIFSVNVVTYHEEESANMASYYDEIEEIAGYEEPRAAPDPDAFAKTLQNCMKFRSFNQLILSNPASPDPEFFRAQSEIIIWGATIIRQFLKNKHKF